MMVEQRVVTITLDKDEVALIDKDWQNLVSAIVANEPKLYDKIPNLYALMDTLGSFKRGGLVIGRSLPPIRDNDKTE